MSSWSSLPDEIKSEVLKFTNFLSSSNVRLCSKRDRDVVESFKVAIPFLKLGISPIYFTLMIIQNPSNILRIDLKTEENSDVRIYRSQSLDCGNEGTLLKSRDFIDEISNLLVGIFKRKLEIESCLIQNNGVEKDHKILRMIQTLFTENCPKRIILSGKSTSESQDSLSSLKKKTCEMVVRNWTKDESRGTWDNWKPIGFKVFEVSKWKTKNGIQEHVTATIGIELVSYLARIESNPQKRVHWIPGYHKEDQERCLRSFPGAEYEQYPNHGIYKVPIDEKRTSFVKFTKCGISIQIGNLKTVNIKSSECGLEWMCPNCGASSMEDWFFRETVRDLHC